MPMYNSIAYSCNYSKTSRSLQQYYRDELPLANGTVVDFPDANNNSALFNFKQKIPGKTGSDNTKDFEMLVPLKCLSGFWRTLEIPLINCKISLILTQSNKCVLSNTADQAKHSKQLIKNSMVEL